MIADIEPMKTIHANGVELAQRYGHVPARARGEPKPWHVALVVWWRFIRRTEATVMAKKIGRDMDPYRTEPKKIGKVTKKRSPKK